MHCVAPGTLLEPDGHDVQLVAPGAAEKDPLEQRSHAVDVVPSFMLYEPAAHVYSGTQALDADDPTGDVNPLEHSVQLEEFEDVEKEPREHELQGAP